MTDTMHISHARIAYNKEHLKDIIADKWEDALVDFEAQNRVDTSNWNFENSDHVARFLNLCIKNSFTDHLFYTLLNLKYISL